MRKQKASDFRYNTGAAKVPWATVGENVRCEDIMEMVRFLVPRGNAPSAKYNAQAAKIGHELEKLCAMGSYATKLTLGDKVKEVEEKIRELLKCKHAVLLTNATAGFEIAHRFAGLAPGDEVIVPAITFTATMAYPLHIGAKVVIADVDPVTLNMDPEDVARKITSRTKVIMPVHLGGYPVDMDPIMKLANARGITVIEDAAHGFGGCYKGKALGTIGHFGAFSFHEVKNINSFGEGGVLVTNEECGSEFPKARFVGFDIAHPIEHWLYDVVTLQWRGARFAPGNHSVTELQALCLLSQLKRLKPIIAARRKVAEYLNRRFADVDGIVTPPLDTKEIQSTHHLYLLQIDPKKLGGNIQEFKAKLTAKGVTQIAHFAPLYRFSILKQLGYDTAAMAATCRRAEHAFLNTFTHLPLYKFSKEQIEYMADAVIACANEMRTHC
jgi:dTDP-4-amino-4,6-dideoxygalactose transaminase